MGDHVGTAIAMAVSIPEAQWDAEEGKGKRRESRNYY